MYTKGISGNPDGRPKGSKNKATNDVKEIFREMIEKSRETIMEDLQAMEPGERLRLIVQLAEYIIPKLQRSSLDLGIDGGINGNLVFLSAANMDQQQIDKYLSNDEPASIDHESI